MGRGGQCVTMAGAPPRAGLCAGSWSVVRCCRWHRELATEKGQVRSGWMRSTAPGRKGTSPNAEPGRGENTTVTMWRTPALSAQVAWDGGNPAVHPLHPWIPPCCTSGDAQLFSSCSLWGTCRIQHHSPGHPPAGQRPQPLRREGGGAPQPHVGDDLRRRLGPDGCGGGVPATWLWHGAVSHQRSSLR